MNFKEMVLSELKNIKLNEEVIETVYKGPDCRIVKEVNAGSFSAIILDVTNKKISKNSHFPYYKGGEPTDIEKITVLKNDIIVLTYTSNKTLKVTQPAIDKNGNDVLKKVVAKIFTIKSRA